MPLVALEAPYLVSALVFLLIYLPVFYIGPAVVIDDLKPAQAVRSSIAHIKMYPVRVVKWTAGGLALLFATAYASHFLFPAYFQWITILINSFLIIPFLLVYQAHNYIEKYGILKRPAKRGRMR